jgi:glycosyltransferase involved in cell wall biosynthesis
MQVVMVTNNALSDKMGGHERYVSDLSAALTRKGISVRIVAKRWRRDSPARETQADGVIVERYRVPEKRNPLYAPLYPLYVAAGLRRSLASKKDKRARTVVHAHMSIPAWPLALSGPPYLFTFHAPIWRELLSERQGSYLLPRPAQKLAVKSIRALERRLAHRATATTVLSEFMRGELGLLDPVAAQRTTVIPGGVDLERFSPGTEQSTQDDTPTLFTARRLTPRTGVDELIRAMVDVRAAFPGVRLQIAGIGAMEAELRSLTAALGLEHKVTFLGRISDNELVEAYRSATLVVMPTRELEGFGLTTAEALACGTAVLGTPAGATPELLLPLDPALVTEDTSAAALARGILGLLSAPERLERIRSRARARVAPAMAWDNVADRYIELYEAMPA